MSDKLRNIAFETVFSLAGLVELERGRVNSLTLSQTEGAKVTVFAIDEGEGMSSHAAPGDALITVLEGTGQITINGVPHVLEAGTSVAMPAGAPHAVLGLTPFKMLLVVVK